MASYCFISLNLIGHCDFGGGSFARSAVELGRRGHEVEWVLSHDFEPAGEQRIVERLSGEGIAVAGPPRLLLSGFQKDAAAVARSVAELEEYLRVREVDVVVIDKMCTYASLAAQRVGLPWASVGTDGLAWGYARRNGLEWLEHGSHRCGSLTAVEELLVTDGWPEPSKCSYWGRSPFLNVSFFPRAFYHDRRDCMPACSHFLGGPRDPDEEGHDREHLLVALGNTFAPAALEPLLRVLEKHLSADESTRVLLLAGDSPLARDLSRLPNVWNPGWMAYDEAFRRSFACIGHGGMNFIWHALHSRVAPLIVPSGIGDQLYNATQMQRHGALVEFPRTSRLSRLAGLGRSGVRLSAAGLGAAVGRLLETKDDCLETKEDRAFPLEGLAAAMEAGGGVAAMVRLLEELGATRAPVTSCPAEPCCC